MPRRWYLNRWLLHVTSWKILALNALGFRRREFPGRDIRVLDEETRAALRGRRVVRGDREEVQRLAGRFSSTCRAPTIVRQVLATIGALAAPRGDRRSRSWRLLSGGVTFADLDVNREEIARFPHSETVILEANHWPLTETPDGTREAIERWIAQLDRRLA